MHMDIHMEVFLVMGTGMCMTVEAVPNRKMVSVPKCMHPPPSKHMQAMDTDMRIDIHKEVFPVMGTGMGIRECVRECVGESLPILTGA